MAPNGRVAVVLETERLLLREMDTGDLPFLVSLLADPEVMRWFHAPLQEEDARDWLARQRERYRTHGYGYWLALDRRNGAPVGQIGVLPIDVGLGGEPALGWILARASWGRGLATEAARASLAWAFDTLSPERVITLIRPENEKSLAVAERLGMTALETISFHDLPHVLYEARPAAE